jgi:serine/threonine-protein kinase
MLIARPTDGNREKLLREACADLDRSLRQGLPRRAETYFAACPLLAAQVQTAVELVYVEFATREELGQRPTPEEYYLRFPQWKAALQRQFAVHEWLRSCPSEQEVLALPNEPTAEVPAWLGQYELLEEIARGGIGRVYRARQHGLDRLVAVKVLRPEIACSLAAREQFCREARVMARLRHPHIMPVHDIGESNGVVYFSMDHMAGGSLADQVADRPPPGFVLGWLEALAGAVEYAHRQGVVHCDLKPSNVLLDEAGHPVLSDFGMAHGPGGEDPAVLRLFFGSPAYMAPEQFEATAGPASPAVDIWALGVLLYELLAGRRPFVSDRLAGLVQLICTQEPAPLRELVPELPARLEAVCSRCLARDPADRYTSAQALIDEVRECRVV